MDFEKLKKQALKLKETATEKTKEAIEYSATKLWESSFTLKDINAFTGYISESKNKKWKNDKTGEEKEFVKQVIVIFVDPKSEFQKKMLLLFPVLFTKSYAQNISIKLADAHMKSLDVKKYKVEEVPSLVVFENEAVKQVVTGEEDIEKVVKWLSLDINKTIDTL